jgi:hypothetical protein
MLCFCPRKRVSLLAHDGQAVSTVWSMAWLFYNTHQFNNLYRPMSRGTCVQRFHNVDAVEVTPLLKTRSYEQKNQLNSITSCSHLVSPSSTKVTVKVLLIKYLSWYLLSQFMFYYYLQKLQHVYILSSNSSVLSIFWLPWPRPSFICPVVNINLKIFF